MAIATVSKFQKVDAERVAESVRAIGEKLDGTGEQTILDFSSVRRMDAKALTAMKELARTADEKTVKVGLRGVSVEIYKVLKLVKLAPRFVFLS
jgi:anti-anti-sigma regulatory factor